MSDSIPFFDMRSELAPIRAALDAAIARVLDSGVLVGGPEVASFERELATALGAPHVVGTSSGTDALLAILMALGIGPGDEVVTTPLSFFATAGAPARLGARVVFADIDAETWTLDPAAALAACTSRVRAIIPVHLFGRPAALPTAPCPIVEDAAQSIGASPVRGIAAALSFFPTKNLGALGDAGAVITHDPELAERVALLRAHGARPKYHHVAIGGNFRLDAIQAAALRTKLPHLDSSTAARRRHADHYRALFRQAELGERVRVPPPHPQHVYHQFAIAVADREALRQWLSARGIATEVYYPEPLHLQPCFKDLDYRPGSLPNAEAACNRLLALPVFPTLAAGAVERVVTEIAAFYATR